MCLLLFFDLPMNTTSELKEYRNFVKNLKKEGFYMLQKSVYVKMVIDNQAAYFVKNKIMNMLPSKGSVMLMNITEKQFSSIDFLCGINKTDVVSSIERVVSL